MELKHKHRNVVIRQLKARPRLFVAIVAALSLLLFLPVEIASHTTTRLLIAWDVGVGLYLLFAFRMIAGSSNEHIKLRAKTQYEGRYIVLTSVALAATSCLAAIFAELAVVKDIHGVPKYEHIALTGFTIASSWLFIHLMFALHYAHDYYLDCGNGISRGLQFPETENPDYLDFLYFSCIIGTSGQTADVGVGSKKMRRIALFQCILAYAYNTTILALTINIASGLI